MDEANRPESLQGGRYLLGKVLGAGGFGITYQCLDRRRQLVCAVKEYFPAAIAARDAAGGRVSPLPEQRRAYEHGKQRFLEEAQVLMKLCRIPGVVQVWESFRENGTAYYVMEFLEGSTLKQVMKAMGGKLPYELGKEVITKAGEALERVHSEGGMFHRDISPENIMIRGDGSVKLIDFGSAKALSTREDQHFSIVLKRGFAPPEQYSSTCEQGSFTDVYALAGTFYFAVTGKLIPDAPGRLAGETYVPLEKLADGCGSEASGAVDKALLLDWRLRTQTVRELIDGLHMGGGKEKSPQKKLVGSLNILTGACAGKRWKLPSGVVFQAGSSPGQRRILIEGHPEISRLHFSVLFEARKQCFYVMDHSRNGLYYQNIRLEKNRRYKVLPGQILAVGSERCTVEMEVMYGTEE